MHTLTVIYVFKCSLFPVSENSSVCRNSYPVICLGGLWQTHITPLPVLPSLPALIQECDRPKVSQGRFEVEIQPGLDVNIAQMRMCGAQDNPLGYKKIVFCIVIKQQKK